LPRIIQAESSDSFQQLRILRNDVTSFAAFLESENSHGIQTRRSWQKGTWANLVAFANAHLLAGERVGVLERAGIDEHGLTIWKSNIFGRDLADALSEPELFNRRAATGRQQMILVKRDARVREGS
jgi:hypothetical protein